MQTALALNSARAAVSFYPHCLADLRRSGAPPLSSAPDVIGYRRPKPPPGQKFIQAIVADQRGLLGLKIDNIKRIPVMGRAEVRFNAPAPDLCGTAITLILRTLLNRRMAVSTKTAEDRSGLIPCQVGHIGAPLHRTFGRQLRPGRTGVSCGTFPA